MRKKRLLSFLLAGCMLLTSPMAVLAQDSDFSVGYDDFSADSIQVEMADYEDILESAEVDEISDISEESDIDAPEILYEEEVVDALEEVDGHAEDAFADTQDDFNDPEAVEEESDPADLSDGEFRTEIHQSISADSDSLNNDALFDQYANEILYAASYKYKDRAGVKRNSAKNLQGVNLAVYQACHQYIEDVAAGKRASTVFKIPIKKLGLKKYQWTAKELGVKSVANSKNVSNAAVKALYKQIGLDLEVVVDALLLDCPYELYWYDKVQGFYYATSFSAPRNSAGKYTTLILNQKSNLEISFPVSISYAAGNYKVNKSTGASVQNAVNNAKQIVRQCAGLTDYEKLRAYRDTICDLVDYNYYYQYYLLSGDDDPWQLIWVFDGDPNTDVVCEGYSKAFQYLCDLTTFNSQVCCYTVTGWLDDETDEGHMWNVVKMYGGKNYFVDVTNSDGNFYGIYLDEFFLIGTPYVTGEGTRYAFIDSEGEEYVSYTYNKETLSQYGRNELALAEENFNSQIIGNCAETGNHKAVVVDPAVEATCIRTGLTEGSHCTDCGNVLVAQQIIPKLSPTYHVTAKSIVLKKGQSTSKIKITGLGKGDSIKSWKSNKPKIASVTSKGVIKGVGIGSAVVTVTLASGAKIKITVKVQKTDVAATAIKGLPKTLELQVGEENTLKPSLSPITCVQKKTYKSSNTKVVTVTSKGVLKAKKVGTAKITVQAGKKKYVIQVTVKAKTAE